MERQKSAIGEITIKRSLVDGNLKTVSSSPSYFFLSARIVVDEDFILISVSQVGIYIVVVAISVIVVVVIIYPGIDLSL